MEKFCDLHTHSVFSDGTDTPFKIVKKAKELGLSAVALTDHNTASGLKELITAGEELSFEVVPGVEISAEYKEIEVHIVLLYLKEESYGRLTEFLSVFSRRKEESNRNLIKGLNSIGIDLDYDELLASAPSGKINRANIGAELVKRGYVKSVEEAFSTVLSEEYGFYVQPKHPSAEETVRFAREINAIPILAHPLLDFSIEQLPSVLAELKKEGLVGVETNYSTFTKKEREALSRLAKEMGILESGGSDYHGENKPDIALGKGKGDLMVPYSFLEEIKKIL